MNYKMIAGLEVHVELKTASKLFCTCRNSFGAEPNTQCCPVCAGLPGALPSLNAEAVRLATIAALALGCDVNERSAFDRKHYFYPDLPKGYQITQHLYPLAKNGVLFLPDSGRHISVERLHIEEDAGKLNHLTEKKITLIDLNRCGVPLAEIVTKPEIHSPEEVKEFLEQLRLCLKYCGVSDCKVEEGSMRVDLNVSIMTLDGQVSERVEVKNIGSITAAMKAAAYEAERLAQVMSDGGKTARETRRWDERRSASVLMRGKEDEAGYRYFPEPDIPPLRLTPRHIETERKKLPELPQDRYRRYTDMLGLSGEVTRTLCSEPELGEYFDSILSMTNSPRETANWVCGPAQRIKSRCGRIPRAEAIAQAVQLAEKGEAGRAAIIQALEATVDKKCSLGEYIVKYGLGKITDVSQITAVVEQVVSESGKVVQDYLEGKMKARGRLVGIAMQRLQGRADPVLLNDTVDAVLNACTND